MCTVLACHVNHCIAYFTGTDAFSSGEYDPFGGEAYGGEVARRERKGECVAAYLVEDAADELVVRNQVVYEVFGGVCELRKGLLYFYLFGQVYECARTLQARIPEGVQLVAFHTGAFNAFVGYLQAAVSLLHLP